MSDLVTARRESPARPDPDAVIREAKRRQHRRWATITIVIVSAAAAVAITTFATRRDRARKPTAHQTATPYRSASVASRPPVAGFLSTAYTSAESHTVTVWNWNGQRRGVVHTGPVVDCCTTVSLSPDGSRLQVWDHQGADIVDLGGRVLFKSPNLVGSWADDSRSRCAFQVQPLPNDRFDGPTSLELIHANGVRQVIATVGYDASHSSPTVLRCSVDSDQAIVGENVMGSLAQVWQVELSTGRVTTPAWAPSTKPVGLGGLVVSGNGDYAAVEDLASGATARTDIINTHTGAIVGHAPGRPLALSWDGHVAVEQHNEYVAVVDWETRAVRWRSRYDPTSSPTAVVAARPNSDDLALAAYSQPGQAYQQAALWLIPANERPRVLTTNALWGMI